MGFSFFVGEGDAEELGGEAVEGGGFDVEAVGGFFVEFLKEFELFGFGVVELVFGFGVFDR